MSLPETLNWCDTHQAGHIGTCDYPNVAVRVAGRDDLLIRREDLDYEVIAAAVACAELEEPIHSTRPIEVWEALGHLTDEDDRNAYRRMARAAIDAVALAAAEGEET